VAEGVVQSAGDGVGKITPRTGEKAQHPATRHHSLGCPGSVPR
jgi:hypothetical protein